MISGLSKRWGDVVVRKHPDKYVTIVGSTVKPFAMEEVLLCTEFSDIQLALQRGEELETAYTLDALLNRYDAIEANLRTRPPLGVGLIAEVCGGAR